MIFSRHGHRLLAGGLIFSISFWFAVQDVAAQGATQVLTPFGYRDSANVHRVPEGYELMRMPDTHIRMHNPKTGDYTDFPKPIAADQNRVPLPDNGWITFASWYNHQGKPISYFGTDWNVPPYRRLTPVRRFFNSTRSNPLVMILFCSQCCSMDPAQREAESIGQLPAGMWWAIKPM